MESYKSKTSNHFIYIKFRDGSCYRKIFVLLTLQGKFILTFNYGNHKYGLSRDTIEDIARDGLASCVHMEIEVSTFHSIDFFLMCKCVYIFGIGEGATVCGSTMCRPNTARPKRNAYKFVRF